MYRPSPEFQKRLDTHSAIDPLEAKALTHEWHRLYHRRQLLSSAIAGVALLGFTVGHYSLDVTQNQVIQAEAAISVQTVGPALDAAKNDNALIFIDGFRSYNADTLTQYMSKAVQPVIDGQLWSVGYNNAPLEPAVIAETIIETATKQSVSSIALVGYSAGGDIAMQVQEDIRKDSNLDIKAIILASTPNGTSTLRPASQANIDLVEKLSWIPGVEYSTYVRFLGELAFRADRYNSGTLVENMQNFQETWAEVSTDFDTSKVPGTWLMFDQMLAIQNADLKARFDTLQNIPVATVRPTIVYLGTAQPGYDYMVDNKKSSNDIAAYAKAAAIPFLSYDVPGAVHTRIDIANDAYIKTLGDAKYAIQSSIEKEESDASLQRITSMIPAKLPQ